MTLNMSNSRQVWDDIWSKEGFENTWRRYPGIFGRIIWSLQNMDNSKDKSVLDVGCGVGILLSRIKNEVGCSSLEGIDISQVAIEVLKQQGIQGNVLDLENPSFVLPTAKVLCATEFVEHLTDPQFERFLSFTPNYETCFVSTPNWCMGPDEESQHHRKLSAIEFLTILRKYRPDWRVECIDHYLLGVAGYPTEKPFKLSFTMPVKNEEADIERVLKSFRGFADEIVIGIDSLSTDGTEAIVRRYADTVFTFEWENHFSKARNACIERCTGDWIFMSEGHEHLKTGGEALLRLQEVPSFIDVIEVRRETTTTHWFFPWLFKNKRDEEGNLTIFYRNAVHNALFYPEEYKVVQAQQISTYHERFWAATVARSLQRKGMNKVELFDRVKKSNYKDLLAMLYLANEFRGEASGFSVQSALKWYKLVISTGKPSPVRYQARLSLHGIYKVLISNLMKLENDPDQESKINQAFLEDLENLNGAATDDIFRTEHWIYLGELYESVSQYEEALRCYEIASLGIGRYPSSYMFINKETYSYLPAQKLTSLLSSMDKWEEALIWAEKVEGLLPNEVPPQFIEETRKNIELIRSKIEERKSS